MRAIRLIKASFIAAGIILSLTGALATLLIALALFVHPSHSSDPSDPSNLSDPYTEPCPLEPLPPPLLPKACSLKPKASPPP